MRSTFYNDGFKDAQNGVTPTPPAPYSFAGNTTNVHAAEYLRGWQDGRYATRPDVAQYNPRTGTITKRSAF